MHKLKAVFFLFSFLIINIYPQSDSILNVDTRDYDQKHVKLDLKFNFDEAKVSGNSEFTFSPLKDDFKRLILHSKTTEVSSVKFNGDDLAFSRDEDHLYIDFKAPLKKNEDAAVTIQYESLPARGLYFFSPEITPEMPYQIWTQGQSDYNRFWYPAYDLPDDKLTSEMIATVDKNLIAVSNGNLIQEKENGDGTKTFHWKMDQPHSNYLTTLIVGEFTTIKESMYDVSLEYNIPGKWVEHRELTYGRTPQMMNFFANYISPYPYKRYAQTSVQDFEWGGMENITATTLNMRIHHTKAAVPNYSADGLIAHELAHQWFGDYLTCLTWDHIWLNEGFATYFTELWFENESGKDEFLYSRYSNNEDYFSALKDEPLEKIFLKEGKIPAELSGGKAYDRGAAILHMLRFKLGDEAFKKGIKDYVNKFKNSSVVSEDFRLAMEESSGEDLSEFFNQWIYGAGFPEFDVSYSYNENNNELTLNVTQVHAELPAVGIFKTPVLIEVVTGRGFFTDTIQISKKEESFTFKINSKPLMVRFNKNSWILCKVNFERGIEELAYQLAYDDDATGRYDAAEKLTAFGDEAVSFLTRAVMRDRFYGVRIRAVKSLKEIGGEKAFDPLMFASNDFDARVSEEALKSLSIFPPEKVVEFLQKKLHTSPNDYERGAAAYSIGAAKAPDAFSILKDALKYDSHRNIIRRGIFDGFKELKDPAVLPLVKEYTKYKYSYGGMHLLDISALECAEAFAEINYEQTIDAIASALDNPYFRTRNKAAELLAKLGAKEKLPVLKQVLENERRIVVREKLIAAIKKLEE